VIAGKTEIPYSVRYDQVNAMVLNEFLKEHKKVQELEFRLAQQEKQIETLSSGLQKIGAELQSSKSPMHRLAGPSLAGGPLSRMRIWACSQNHLFDWRRPIEN
jgi:uncharacterized coiled-coil protein SlyX